MCIRDRITVPFAADVVRKTGFAVLRRFEKPFQVLFVLCIPAVSYTHLDVYKRQLYDLIEQ